MAFGQQQGPLASRRQMEELLGLLHDAGFSDFRDARHPFDLTQRQAAGRFTRDEAEGLIDRLRETEPSAVPTSADQSPKLVAAQNLLRLLPPEQLAAELERRGWVVIAP
jgi:hypothetical protein